MLRRVIRYSEAFKQKVVKEVEEGKWRNCLEARKVYDIRGGATILKWQERYGKNKNIGRVVRVETKGEREHIKELEKEKRLLESALASAQVKLVAYESLFKCAKDIYGIDLKKNSGGKVSADLVEAITE